MPEEFQNENNLVYASLVDALREWGEEPFPRENRHPDGGARPRGLGSSSTCVVAGIMAAAALTGHTVDRAELVRIATAVEGHPDNVAPAILGGADARSRPRADFPAACATRSAIALAPSPSSRLRGSHERGAEGRAAAGRTRRRRMADGPHHRHDARPGDGRPCAHRGRKRRPLTGALPVARSSPITTASAQPPGRRRRNTVRTPARARPSWR